MSGLVSGLDSHQLLCDDAAELAMLMGGGVFVLADQRTHSALNPQVTLVGVIRGVTPFVTYILYSVDDMTGPPFKVKLWMNGEVGSEAYFQCLTVSLHGPGSTFSPRTACFLYYLLVPTSRSWGASVISRYVSFPPKRNV